MGITARYAIVGDADSGNAAVTDWRQGARATIRSQVTDAALAEDFNLLGADGIGE